MIDKIESCGCEGEPHTCDQEAIAAAEGRTDRLIIENADLRAENARLMSLVGEAMNPPAGDYRAETIASHLWLTQHAIPTQRDGKQLTLAERVRFVAEDRNGAQSVAIENLKARLAVVEAERDEWKRNHGELVIDRAEVMSDLIVAHRERDSLRSRLASVEKLCSDLAHDFDQVLAAHDPEHPQHRSHGGQHHNGRCCSFGNVNPSSLREFRFLRDRIRAALAKKETL